MGSFGQVWEIHKKLPWHGLNDYLNADFKPVWDGTAGFEGGFQNMEKDSANYCPAKGKPGSQLIGTKYGISAIGMAEYLKRCPTVAEIKNLKEPEAMKIAKSQYWDKIQGDKIKSQGIAHLIFDSTYGGSAGPLQVRQTINALKGKGTVKEYKSFKLDNAEIELVNKLPEKQFFSDLYKRRLNFYKGHTYENGLTNRLNKLKNLYMANLDTTAKFAKNNIASILIVSSLVGLGLYLLLRKK